MPQVTTVGTPTMGSEPSEPLCKGPTKCSQGGGDGVSISLGNDQSNKLVQAPPTLNPGDFGVWARAHP